jgi:hypothetical protein
MDYKYQPVNALKGNYHRLVLKLYTTYKYTVKTGYLSIKLRGIKVKQSHYMPQQAQRVCRDIALLFRDLGARREWVVSLTPRPLYPGKDPVPIVQEAGWASGPVWTCAKNLVSTGIRSPDRPARSQSLYRMSYPAHKLSGTIYMYIYIHGVQSRSTSKWCTLDNVFLKAQ